MEKNRKILEKIYNEFNKLGMASNAKAREQVQRKIYPELPSDNDQLMELFDFLVSVEEWRLFWLVTMWIKRRKELYKLKYMSYYEKWLYNYINHWGTCDVFCYRVLNPMVDKYPQLFQNVLKWTDSTKTYVRRAAPVSLLKSNRSFTVNCSFEKVYTIAEKLKHDDEIHVQKGVGWLLKYAYLSYPEKIYNYLKNNVNNLPRTIFRYALEKAPQDIKEELMSL
ncbi:DNA alkylation repair protein [Thermohalobacter berrensis]|uniref:DNA alkylation repair protein n=1 Tax=Thermohalobacter berrensis TaxID=99594 RepID=A0A419TA85_9FIRM|nr:DNA alkylation repair protein [Thermohalobacter berrensis]RKD34381.1 hypothetical protein BET03_00685 [Thermohalobacter berrensis]